MKRLCIYDLDAHHKTKHCFHLKGFAEKVLKLPKPKSKKPELRKNDSNKDDKAKFLEPSQDLMYIFRGPNSYESKRKQKLMERGVFTMESTTLEFL